MNHCIKYFGKDTQKKNVHGSHLGILIFLLFKKCMSFR